MAFSVKSKKSGTEYFLHGRPSANGKSVLRYFAKAVTPELALDSIPDGYELSENSATGLPILKKKAV